MTPMKNPTNCRRFNDKEITPRITIKMTTYMILLFLIVILAFLAYFNITLDYNYIRSVSLWIVREAFWFLQDHFKFSISLN